MPNDRTQVINNGLRLIGANQIEDPNEESESARQASAIYDDTVREEIEKQAWYFAMAKAQLATTTAPLFGFAYAYNVPNDFVRLVFLEDRWVFPVLRNAIDTNPTPIYAMEGRTITTDFGAPLEITYLRDLSGEPTLWSPLFGQVVAAALATKLAFTLTKSDGIVKLAEALYQKAVKAANRSNAIQRPPQNIPDGSWITARYG